MDKTPRACYEWRGVTPNGVKKQGIKQCASLGELYLWLAKRKITPTKTRKRARQKPTRAAVSNLFAQLSMLLRAGLPIPSALKLLFQQASSARDKAFYAEICDDIEDGLPLSQSLEGHLKTRDRLAVELIRIGESSGNLSKVLSMLVASREKEARARKALIQAGTYPVIIILAALAVIVLMLTRIVPAFEALYTQNNASLPAYTQLMIRLSDYALDYGANIALASLATAALAVIALRTSDRAKAWWSLCLARAPILGAGRKAFMARRFASILALTYSAGMSIDKAIRRMLPLFPDALCRAALQRIGEQIEQGVYLHAAVADTRFFPPLVTQMLEVGETCGKMSETLERLEQHYENQITETTKRAMQLLEPCLIVIVAGIVCWIVISMYAPVFHIGSGL